MKKRCTAMVAVLILSLLLPMLPGKAYATEASLEDIIGKQYDAYVEQLPLDGTADTAMRLVAHSIKGGGKLTMGADDVFTGGLFATELFRYYFVQVASDATDFMQSQSMDVLYVNGTLGWYNDRLTRGYFAFEDSEGSDPKRDPTIPGFPSKAGEVNVSCNGYDKAMMLVVGSGSSQMKFQRISATEDTATYRVTIKISDTFDFTGDSSNLDLDSSLTSLLRYLGQLLSLGLLTTFQWSANAEMTLTVPNTCTHICTERVVSPTCIDVGYTEHTCSRCGVIFRDTETPARGHSFGDWVVTREPTYQKPGEQSRSCVDCGHTERVEIPKLEPLPGDATCDGNINGKDLVTVRQHLAGWSVNVHATGADVNRDGKIDGRDLLLLRQYLSGWDVKLG